MFVSASPALPVFSTREARFRKARDANTLLFSIPTHSSLLLPLLRPVSHSYEQQDARCLHLLQTVALVPSCKCRKLLATVRQALKMPLFPKKKSQLEASLLPLLTKLQEESQESGSRPLIALRLKEKVAEVLRCWIADPIEGFVLRKEHVVNGMRLDDLVATPTGAGYLRDYRREDGFCTVLYPWGHGFVHVKDVEKVQQALDKHLKKRAYNEFVALEHQQLYEQIEGLLENLPPVSQEGDAVKKKESVAGEEGDVGLEEYKELLTSLEEEHVDTTVLREDLGFLRRVQALTKKVKELRRAQTPKEPKRKLQRTDEDFEMQGETERQQSEELKLQEEQGPEKQPVESKMQEMPSESKEEEEAKQ